MKLINKNILIISPEPWGKSFVSKHHYALELAGRGNNVFFLNPPKNDFIGNSHVYEINENLKIIDYSNAFKGINYLPGKLNDIFSYFLIKRILKNIGNIKFDVVWSFDPFRFQNLDLFCASFKIYHTVDVHNTSLEHRIAKYSDILLATSERILAKFDTTQLKKFKINHGLAASFLYDSVIDENGNTDTKGPVKVGYIGNLNYHFLDRKVLKEIILNNKQIEFYFIGPYIQSKLSTVNVNNDFIDFLKEQSHVHLLGEIASPELVKYIHTFDLFLMCYLGSTYKAQMANPHKILEYLISGKIIVSHYIDEYKDKRELLLMANQNEDIPGLFKKAIDNLEYYNHPKYVERRVGYALDNTYLKQIERIEKLIAENYNP